MFLFAGFDFKCLAVCYRRNGFYNLSKRSKCCSVMTNSRRLLQRNAAFMILLFFSVVVYLRTWITCTDCSGCSSELLHCHGGNSWFTHNFPHTKISASTSKGLGIHLWYQSGAFIRLAPFDSRVSSDSKQFTIAAIEEVSPDYLSEELNVKSNACLCARNLEQSCTTNSKKLCQVSVC